MLPLFKGDILELGYKCGVSGKKKRAAILQPFNFMVGPAGLEPATT